MGKVATSPLPPRGSPPLQSGGQNQKWPTSGQGGYITATASGIPTASKRGAKSEVAHKWAASGIPTASKRGAGGYITPAASGIPTASKRGAKSDSGGSRGAKSQVAHTWALHALAASGMGKVATSPLPPRGSPPLPPPHRFKAGGKIRSGPYMGKVANPCGGQNQKWPINGQGGYITHTWAISLAASGIATASKRGAKSEVAHI